MAMQPQGLQALMPQRPQADTPMRPAMPQQSPAPQAMQNPQRMGAAMGLVDNDLEQLGIDPKTRAAMKAQEAVDLLASADADMAMAQPKLVPEQIVDQRKQQASEGIRGLLSQLMPGLQQRGQQMQARPSMAMGGMGAPARPAPARPPMGGMPSMGAPNMNRMAMGGIVGYMDGGDVEGKKPQIPMVGQTQNPSPGYLDPEVAAFLRRLEELNKQLDAAFPQEKDLFEQKITDLLNTTSPRVKRIASDSQFGLPKKDGMAMGGIVGYAGPTGSLVGGMSADEDFTNSNIYMPNELAGSEDEDILRRARERMGRDPEAEAIAAGERLRGLIGADELMAQRAKEQAALDARREAMFSPEETRRRRISAGLAGLAERGLGGFGAGDTAERDKISAERIASSEASVANMDKLIGELRELGMSQFEAEKQARDMVERGIDQGMDTAQAVLASRRQAADAAANRATQERGQDITREVGLAQVSKNTDFMNEIDIRVNALQMDNPSLSKIEAQKQALEERIEAQARAQLLANNIRTDTLELDRLKAAYSMAASRLANNPLAATDPEAYRRAFDEEVRNITAQFSAPSGGNTGAGVPVPSSANDLVVGTVYNTARGPATWNGTSFIPVN
jgi:hypothetical protein